MVAVPAALPVAMPVVVLIPNADVGVLVLAHVPPEVALA